MEHSDATTLDILGTLAHFSHSLRFTQAKPIISAHAQRTWFLKLNKLNPSTSHLNLTSLYKVAKPKKFPQS